MFTVAYFRDIDISGRNDWTDTYIFLSEVSISYQPVSCACRGHRLWGNVEVKFSLNIQRALLNK
jgi:hypothetical protein